MSPCMTVKANTELQSSGENGISSVWKGYKQFIYPGICGNVKKFSEEACVGQDVSWPVIHI